MKKRLEATIYGTVQGVMMRDFVQRKARTISLVGFVRNNSDGSVEVVAEGEEDNLKQLEWFLWKGPIHTRIKLRVENVKSKYLEPKDEFRYFNILYD